MYMMKASSEKLKMAAYLMVLYPRVMKSEEVCCLCLSFGSTLIHAKSVVWNYQFLLAGTRQNSVDSLAFETLIPKSIIQRYISLLLEHRRIILCGPSGTGKTYLAQKLAEHLVLR